MFKSAKAIGISGVVLLVMLIAEADAHYMYASGRWVYHSVGCIAEVESVSNPSTTPAVVECAVSTTLVETLCQDASGYVYPVTLPLQVGLSAAVPIAVEHVSEGLAEVEVVVPDAPLLDINVNLACVGATPIDVMVRNMASTVTVSRCVGSILGPCEVRLVTSTAEAVCELPPQFNFSNYPENLPPEGTPYSCTEPLVVHVF